MAEASEPCGDAGGGPVAVAICVPARDEAGHLPALFAAIDRLAEPAGVRLYPCLLLDGCIDDSLPLAERWRDRSRHGVTVATVERTASNAGRARDLAMRLGMEAVGAAGLLLTTDADSVPAPDWVTTMLAGLAQADIVAGQVLRRGGGSNPEQDRIERYYARLFAVRRRIDPVAWEASPSHPMASGANMGMSSAVYRRIGGFPAIEHGEDARLIDDAARAGLRVRRDAASIVHTSERRVGRVQGGLATMLHAVDRQGLDGVVVAHPDDQIWQYRMQAQARAGFASGDMATLSAALGLSADHLRGVARDCPNAEAFAMRVVPAPAGGMRHVPFLRAEAMLSELADGAPAHAPGEAA